jgi:hypothetical protein
LGIGDPGKLKGIGLWGVGKKKPQLLFAASNKGRTSEVNEGKIEPLIRINKHE